MNGNYYQNPAFPNSIDNYSNDVIEVNSNLGQNSDYGEQSYIENILRLNKGKKVKAYVAFPDSEAWKNKIFEGIIEEAGKDHLIIKDTVNNNWYLILLIYLNYVEFMEKINYVHSFSEKTF